jgi:hypothetical protein
MPAGDRVQIGKAFKVEFGGAVWTGYQLTSLTNQATANVESIMDTRNAAVSHQITNPGKSIAIAAMIEDVGGSITPPGVGDIVVITPPGETRGQAWILLASAPISHSNGISTISATLTREDSMAAHYEASISASLESEAEDFSVGSPADIELDINYTAQATSIVQVLKGATPVPATSNWEVVFGPRLQIKHPYLSSELTTAGDELVLTIRFNVGNDATLTITAIA